MVKHGIYRKSGSGEAFAIKDLIKCMEKYKITLWAFKNRNYLYGALIGAIAGFLYWKFVGCNGGNCMISSKPLNSMVYFAASGMLIANAFKKREAK